MQYMHKLRTLRVLYMYALPLYVVNDWRRASILYSLLQDYITNRKFIKNQATSQFFVPVVDRGEMAKIERVVARPRGLPHLPASISDPEIAPIFPFRSLKIASFFSLFSRKMRGFFVPVVDRGRIFETEQVVADLRGLLLPSAPSYDLVIAPIFSSRLLKIAAILVTRTPTSGLRVLLYVIYSISKISVCV